jgi:hypothetical protein
MFGYIFAGFVGAAIASFGWWVNARSLKGVISDLQNAKTVVESAPAQAAAAAADAVKKVTG